MKYVDAHCHLKSDTRFCGVSLAIVNATRPTDWDTIGNYAGQGGVFGAIGVHPWFVSVLVADWVDQMRTLLTTNPHLMIGEVGLDKNHPDMTTQLDVFTIQMQMAAEFGRIAHIHCVGAWDKIFSVLALHTPPAIVLHGFDASPEIIHQLLKYNVYFSFGRAICDLRRQRARNAVRTVPENRILSESDTANSGDVIPVVAKISEILARPLADTVDTIYNNAKDLLKNGQIA